MLSSVAKLADKTFVIGFLLPSMLGVYAVIRLFGCAAWYTQLCDVDPKDPFANVTYLALVVWFVAVLLMALNYVAYRLLEGYLPPVAWLNGVRDAHRARYRELIAEYRRLMTANDRHGGSEVRRRLLAQYPSGAAAVLPTAFGNHMRAFETYSRAVYGADSIPLWNRLMSVVPANFQGLINDARSQVDFLVNLMIVSSVVAAIAIGRYVDEFATLHDAALPADGRYLIAIAAVSLAAAAFVYRMSFDAITQWGDLVKSAFDCYLPALAAQLGYQLPPGAAQRRRFWRDISRLLIYEKKIPGGRWGFANTPQRAPDAPGTHDGGGDDD